MLRLSYLVTGLLAFAVTAVCGFALIPFLKKLHFGQTIKEIGPTWHRPKQGTPTMGGFMFYLGVLVAVCRGVSLLWREERVYESPGFSSQIISLCLTLIFPLLYGLVGFADDYIKVIKKQNLGLKARFKIIFQAIITALFLFAQFYTGHVSTIIKLPFAGAFDISYRYYPLAFLGIIFMVNAVNLTDGIDGLCTSVTFAVSLGFLIISATYGYYTNTLFSVALAGACVGFLVWNFHPAKVFMGDTGSMFLGGAVVSMAWAVNRPEILIFMGLVYTIEALSVVIQVLYFKISHGKRIFKMSPIHHHFEMSGWSEEKIVIVFTAVAAIGSALGVLSF